MPTDLLVLGNLLLDDVVHDDGTARMRQPGGAALYVALGARLWGVETSIVSVVGDDYPGEILDALARRGVGLDGVRRRPGPTLRTWLLYEGRRRRVVHRLGGPTHAEVSPTPADLPAAAAHTVHLAPMPFETQRRLVAALATGNRPALSLDPYELLLAETLPDWRELAATVDLLFLSEDEMAIEGGLETPEPVLAELLGAGRPAYLLYKQGRRGGRVFGPRGTAVAGWEPRPGPVVDPTGAGDAFAGGFLAGLALGDTLGRALCRGAISARFALAGFGPEALFATGPDEAEKLLARNAG